MQHVIDHLACIARMTNADADTKKLTATEMIDDIAQTIMTAVATRLLDTIGAGR